MSFPFDEEEPRPRAHKKRVDPGERFANIGTHIILYGALAIVTMAIIGVLFQLAQWMF